MKVEFPPVLILASDAGEYLPFFEELSGAGVNFTAVATAGAAREAYSGQEIVLGQPDLVARVISEWPEVRWVQSSWAGVTPILNTGRTDYLLTGVKDTFGPDMAEYVLGYLLANELKIFERLGRQANRSWWDEHSGTLQGKTIGIMGTGSIGSYFARMLKPFGVTVTGFSRSGAPVEGFDRVYPADQLKRFLAEPDYVVCVLPDTPETRLLLDAEAFKCMKKQCCLVNVGRGNLVDETALAQRPLCRRTGWRRARCVPAGAFAGGQPLVERPWRDRDGTYFRREPAKRHRRHFPGKLPEVLCR